MGGPSAETAANVYRIAAGARSTPLVIDVSRSGTLYPPEFLPTAPFESVHRKISPYVERLVLPCADTGATVIMAAFPPTFVDPNRPIDDIDPEQLSGAWPTAVSPLPGSQRAGTGLIHSLSADYEPLYNRKLSVSEVQKRISLYYEPYHEKLSELLHTARALNGKAYHLSCHSMSSVGPMDGQQRPEICLGDLDGATADEAYIAAVAKVFSEAGLEVTFNKPFRGNELLRRHASPHTGCYSLQVEVRRDLYISEDTREPHDGLFRLQECFLRIADSVGGIC